MSSSKEGKDEMRASCDRVFGRRRHLWVEGFDLIARSNLPNVGLAHEDATSSC